MSLHAAQTSPAAISPESPKDTNGQPSGQVASKAEIVWEDPGAPKNRNRKVNGALAGLTPFPRRWARVFTLDNRAKAASLAQQINSKAGYEGASRRLYEGDDQGKYGVFARFVGDAK